MTLWEDLDMDCWEGTVKAVDETGREVMSYVIQEPES